MAVRARRPGVARALRWAGPALLVAELALVLTGRLSLRTAAVVLVALEAALALVAAGQLAGGIRWYRRQRAGGADREQALQDALRAVLPGPVAVVVRHELLLWSSLVLLARGRRQGVPDGAVAISYDAALRPVGLLLVGLSVVELVVLELVVPWQRVRLVLLVLGAWTLLLVLGITAANIVRPHVVTAGRLRLRSGTFADVQIPLDRVATATVRRRDAPSSKALLLDAGVLVIGVSGTTDADVDLIEPPVVQTSRGACTAHAARFAADDPAAAVRALADRLGPEPARRSS